MSSMITSALVPTTATPLWHTVGLSSQLPEAGDYRSIDIDGEPLVVLRNGDGELRALSRVCRHRGFDMLEGTGPAGGDLCGSTGRVKRISCPYHAWTYNLDGQLIGAPVSDGIPDFDKGCVSLPRFDVAEADGVVFVCLDAPAPDLAAQLQDQQTTAAELAEQFRRNTRGEGAR